MLVLVVRIYKNSEDSFMGHIIPNKEDIYGPFNTREDVKMFVNDEKFKEKYKFVERSYSINQLQKTIDKDME